MSGSVLQMMTEHGSTHWWLVWEFLRAAIYERLIHLLLVAVDTARSGNALLWVSALAGLASLAGLLWDKWSAFARAARTLFGQDADAPPTPTTRQSAPPLTRDEREKQRRTFLHLSRLVSEEAESICVSIEPLTGPWRQTILDKGPQKFCNSLKRSKHAVRRLARKVRTSVRNCKSNDKEFLQSIAKLDFCERYVAASDILLDAVHRLPRNPEEPILALLTAQHAQFANAVTTFRREAAELQRQLDSRIDQLDLI